MNFFKKIKPFKKKIIIRFLLASTFIGMLFISLVLGAYLNKTGNTVLLKQLVVKLSVGDFSFFSNHSNADDTEIQNFNIIIKDKNYKKLQYYRNKAVVQEHITDDLQKKIPAIIEYNGQEYKVDIAITGLVDQHVQNPSKYSLSVKVKGGKTIMGMKKFAILIPLARGYLTDWLATKLLEPQGVVGIRTDFINVTINGNNNGIYYLEERFDKRLIENNKKKEGIIFKIENSEINAYGLKKIKNNKTLLSQYVLLNQLWYSFLNCEISVNKLFDINKIASFYVVSDIVNMKHAISLDNIRFYFNPLTNLIEPIGREWEELKNEDKSITCMFIDRPNPNVSYHEKLCEDLILRKVYDNFIFKEEYIKQADVLTKPKYVDSVLNTHKTEMEILLKKLHNQNPFYNVPYEVLHRNQKTLRDKLYDPNVFIKAFYKNNDDNNITLLVENKISLPIEIHYYTYKGKYIYNKERTILKSDFKTDNKYQEIILPKYANDTIPFNIEEVELYYSILGLNDIRKTIVYPKEMDKHDYAELSITQAKANCKDFSFIKTDTINKTISFISDKCIINKDLIIPKGYIVYANAGCTIDLTNNAKIISYSALKFIGTNEKPLIIRSSDKTGQGIVVFSAKNLSEINYVKFYDLSNPDEKNWSLTGAVTFYESKVNINNCVFEKNLKGDDYLNIIRTNFSMQNSKFIKTNADAFDGDFIEGAIKNVQFIDVGNDAIDVSGSTINIENITITNPADKGISAGENSNLTCNNVIVQGGEIAIVSKDNSKLRINKLDIKDCKLAYCAFQKKAEFGPASITITNSIINNVKNIHLIEINSELFIGNKEIREKKENVKDLLYGAEFGKASK